MAKYIHMQMDGLWVYRCTDLADQGRARAGCCFSGNL